MSPSSRLCLQISCEWHNSPPFLGKFLPSPGVIVSIVTPYHILFRVLHKGDASKLDVPLPVERESDDNQRERSVRCSSVLDRGLLIADLLFPYQVSSINRLGTASIAPFRPTLLFDLSYPHELLPLFDQFICSRVEFYDV